MGLRSRIRAFLRPELRSTDWANALARLQHIDAGKQYRSGRYLAARELAAGMVSRAFMSAEISPANPALDPLTLSQIARELVSNGDSIWRITVSGGALKLYPCAWTQIYGDSPDVDSWVYECSNATPTGGLIVKKVPAADVLHFRYSYESDTSWDGKSAFSRSRDSVQAGTNNESRLSDELQQPSGSIIPAPIGGGSDDDFSALQSSLSKLRGGPLLVESMDSSWGGGVRHNTGNVGGWSQMRLGARPPAELVKLLTELTSLNAMSAGIPAELSRNDASSQSKREALRQLLHTTVKPLGRLVEYEIAKKLESPIKLSFRELYAADVQGRARSLKSLVDAGIDLQQARELTGFA